MSRPEISCVNLFQDGTLEKVRQSASLNYGNSLIRYENGDVSFTQLMENGNKLIVTESELLQANYLLLLKQVVLGFYFP